MKFIKLYILLYLFYQNENYFFNIIDILILKFDFKKSIWYLLKSNNLDEYRRKLNIKLENNFKRIFFKNRAW